MLLPALTYFTYFLFSIASKNKSQSNTIIGKFFKRQQTALTVDHHGGRVWSVAPVAAPEAAPEAAPGPQQSVYGVVTLDGRKRTRLG